MTYESLDSAWNLHGTAEIYTDRFRGHWIDRIVCVRCAASFGIEDSTFPVLIAGWDPDAHEVRCPRCYSSAVHVHFVEEIP